MADATEKPTQAKDKQAKEAQAKGAEAKQKSVEAAYGHQGKPTPTQEECDLAALGMTLDEHEDDGSGPSPEFRMVNVAKQSEAKPSGGGYTTRSTQPVAAPAAPPAKHP